MHSATLIVSILILYALLGIWIIQTIRTIIKLGFMETLNEESPGSTNAQKRSDRFVWIAVILGGVALIVWFCNWFLLDHYIEKPADRGVFGDKFGMSTSLFGSFTIGLLLYTIYLQRKENIDSKEDFQRELTSSKRLRFESAFFKMIDIHLTNLRAIKLYSDFGITAVYNFVYNHLFPDLQNNPKSTVYNEILETQDFDIISSQYVRSLAVVYESIKTYTTDPIVAARYTEILKAYVSVAELEFLALHCAFVTRSTPNKRELDLLKEFLKVSGLYNEAGESLKKQISLPSLNDLP